MTNLYQEVRQKFKQYFANHGHEIIKSSSLIPHNDPTLLFTNSGMVQFKNTFIGLEEPKYNKATTVQKSLRAGGKHNDLDNVGYTTRHHTFFEMLGNFSFGNYFKEDAIHHAWNVLTKEFAINPNRLYITIYHTDDEAMNIWKKLTGFGDDRIIKISTNDNFWSMGSSGPCGPCSEIYYDYGDKVSGGKPGSKEADGERFVEIWNLVFMQFNQLENGTMTKLSKQCIDTGMGIERLVSVLEGKTDNYDTQLFRALINNSRNILNDDKEKNAIAHRVIADHLRATSFLIADGILPSNEGRGYVLRRIMRRAMRYLHQIDDKNVSMHKLFDKLQNEMQEEYPELRQNSQLIKMTIQNEEEGFKNTLDRGMRFLKEELYKIAQIKGDFNNNDLKILSGKSIPSSATFKLYDTYGFPFDMTADFARRIGMNCSEQDFENEMQIQRENSRKSWSGSGDSKDLPIWFELANKLNTEFIGYNDPACEAKVIGIVVNGINVQETSDISQPTYIILDKTPFYPEGGGQIADSGKLYSSTNKSHPIANIVNVLKYAEKLIIHKIEFLEGKISLGDRLICQIDQSKRINSCQNHSATHLLQAALAQILGSHVRQSGSLVTDESLRFDFTHQKALSQNEVHEIESLVNFWIQKAIPCKSLIVSKEESEKMGAKAFFGDKYGDKVRVVQFENASIELCGGTHVENTGNIGIFKIISEGSIASGVRRIEAITGNVALKYLQSTEQNLRNIADLMQIPFTPMNQEIPNAISQILIKNRELKRRNQEMEVKILANKTLDRIDKNGITYYFTSFCGVDSSLQKDIAGQILNRIEENSIACIVFENSGKNTLAICSKNEANPANALIKTITETCDGKASGGGSAKTAMSGINADINRVSDALLKNN